MMRYHEALDRCLAALAEGRDLESVLAGLPARHRERLRRDASLSEALRRHAVTLSAPSAAAEVNALSRLNLELSSARAGRETAVSRGAFFGVPRFALAGLLLAALLVGASFVIDPKRGGDGTVEAAEFEGVVVASGEGSLTVQTLDSLEEVTVPLDAMVRDEDGTALQLGALEAGEVVSVRGNREAGGPVHALDVRRLLNGLPGWCNENPERCRQIAENLREAQARCQREPQVCRLLHDRVSDLVTRVTDVADLEALQQRCRGGGEGCSDIISFCRERREACTRDFPPDPVTDRIEEARNRLRQLETLCRERDTRACRLIAQICTEHAALCTDTPLPPRAPISNGPSGARPPEPPPTTEAEPSREPPAALPPHGDDSPTADAAPESSQEAPRFDDGGSEAGDASDRSR